MGVRTAVKLVRTTCMKDSDRSSIVSANISMYVLPCAYNMPQYNTVFSIRHYAFADVSLEAIQET